MTISAAASSYRLFLKSSPHYTATTLAEIQPAVDGAPATYEGKYVVALDQAAGQQLYLVESGVVRAAYDQSGYKAELDDDRYYNGDGTQVTGAIGVQWFSATTNSNGQVIVHATTNGTSGAAALFSSIKSVSVEPEGIASQIIDRVYAAGHTVTSGKTITAQILRGSVVVLGGTGTRIAPSGVTVKVRVEGVLA